MPTTEQFNKLTESNSGRNVRPKIQPESHFFLEGNDYTQVEGQAFGPLSTDVFRTTAKVTLDATKKVYTICKGQVFVQPHIGDDTKVNVILRPFKQPINEIGIKYFIYRGLKKSDFLNVGDGNVAAKPTTEFTTFVWDEFEKFYEDEDTTPDFSDYFIGWPQTPVGQPETSLIEKYFNKITPIIDPETGAEEANFSYELPIIPRGTQLGTIDSGEEIGLDIVLNFGEYYIEGDTNPFLLDIAFARMADGIIDLTDIMLDGADDAVGLFQRKLLREATTQFIDPAAFYGMHTNGAGKLHFDDDADPAKTTPTDIYNKISGFYTKNNIYCYIQANRQRSYNFYGNYEHSVGNTNTLKIGAAEDALTETTFGTLGWPVHIYSSTADQDPATAKNTITFQLTTDAHAMAVLYVQTGFITSEHENNFIRQNHLLESPSGDVAVYYTKPLNLETPSEGIDFIAGLVQCIYKGKQMYVEEFHDPLPTVPAIHKIKDIDELFGLVNANSFLQAKNDELPQVLGEKIGFIQIPINQTQYAKGVAKVKKVKDKIKTSEDGVFLGRVTYETVLTSSLNRNSAYLKSSSSHIDSNVSKLEGYGTGLFSFYRPLEPYYFSTNLFSDNGKAITGIKLYCDEKTIPSKLILGISEEENDELLLVFNEYNLINPTLFFEEITESNRSLVNETTYKKYRIGIVGETVEGDIFLNFPEFDVIVYSIDCFMFFSKIYGDSVPQFFGNEEDLTLNFGPWVEQGL